MYHLVVFLLLAGQPIDAGTKPELSLDACQADLETLPPKMLEAVKAAGAPAEVTVKAACLDDIQFKELIDANTPPAEKRGASIGEERID